jgi:hypothetical protein
MEKAWHDLEELQQAMMAKVDAVELNSAETTEDVSKVILKKVPLVAASTATPPVTVEPLHGPFTHKAAEDLPAIPRDQATTRADVTPSVCKGLMRTMGLHPHGSPKSQR